MRETLDVPDAHDGRLWHHQTRGATHRPHHHTEVEFNLITHGTAAYLVGDRRYDLRPGTLVWLFPEQDHVLLDQSPGLTLWIGVFRPALLHRACTDVRNAPLLADDPAEHFCRRIGDADARRLETLCAEVTAVGDDTDHYNVGLAYVLLACWAAYGRAEDGPTPADVHPAVEQAVRLLRDETDALTLDQLSRHCGLSPSRLSRLFARQTGVSLVDFRNTQRLERFLRLYGQGRRLSLTEAALEAGFGSYPQFHRIFKQRLGYGPAEHRRQYQQDR